VKDAAKLLNAVDPASRYWESCYNQ